MQGITVNVNYAELAKDFEKSLEYYPQILKAVDQTVKDHFNKCKTFMMNSFNNHKITEEIREGPEAENISDTLNGQEGNLYSFLGFSFGSDPTKELEHLLDAGTRIIKSTRRGTTFYYRVYYPDKEEVANSSRMHWGAGNSWAFGVENGDFGGDAALSHYIYKTYLAGRSTQGVQIKGVYSENNFSPKPYITEIMNNFINKINNNK